MICVDEQERTFIVEMQLGYYEQFMQRTKFYAFQKFNTLVRKGNYKFDDLTPIYCIGILAKGIFPKSEEYYHFGRLKNQKGEELDDQITHIIVEIDKFDKEEVDIKSDLDKLIYIMKNLEHIKGLDELPKFLTEDWIEQAMNKVDKSQMTPEQRMFFEMMLAKNGSIIAMMEKEKEELKEEGAHQAMLQMAKQMKQAGESIEKIMKYTNLAEEEIEKL